MACKYDDLHYSFRAVDGFQKAFVFVMSCREPGKTTSMWRKIYEGWKRDKRPWIVLTRTSVEISEAFLTSIQDSQINKFHDDQIQFKYNKGTFKDGIVDVKIGDEIFFRIVSLSIPLRRIKLAVLRNVKAAFMDEYIIDPRTGEKYITEEAFKIQEAYTTWRRECDGLFKMYFCGNQYSLFNPLFVAWNVDTGKLRKDDFYVGQHFVIHWAVINPKLREKLLQENPLYQFDEDYTSYALEGLPINDRNIPLGDQPEGFYLRFIFTIGGKKISIFQSGTPGGSPAFYCEFSKNVSSERLVYCFDLADIIKGTQLISVDAKIRLARFKDCITRGEVIFSEIPVYYLILEAWKQL